jgi:hypothetical protein
MWTLQAAAIDEDTLHWGRIRSSAADLSFEQVYAGWRTDAAFRAFWIEGLKALEFPAYCWECPPVSDATRGTPFECVFVSSPSLARMGTDRDAFAEHFRPDCDVAIFENLGGDATLIAPCPDEAGNFAQLGSFTATAPAGRQNALWQAVGEALASRVGVRPLWLSTAGHGIAWLHVRLDSRPKYYRHAAYRRA